MTTESTPKEPTKKLHPDTQELLDNAAKKQQEKIANNPFEQLKKPEPEKLAP